MLSMWWLWVRNRRSGVAAVLSAFMAALIVVAIARAGGVAGLTFLGDAVAPSLTVQDSAAPLPHANAETSTGPASLLDTPLPASAGPQTVAAAQAAWRAEEIMRRQVEVLSAYNCARRQQGLPPLTLDPALSGTAGAAWLKLVHDPRFTLMDLPGTYAARGVLALDFSTPTHVATSARWPQAPAGASCTMGGFDAATMPTTPASLAIGIAVFPPQASWDSASAVVLVR